MAELNTELSAALVAALDALVPIDLPPPPEWIGAVEELRALSITMEEAATSADLDHMERRLQWKAHPFTYAQPNRVILIKLDQINPVPRMDRTPEGW